MSLEQTLDALRELGVYIPEGLDNTQLTNLAKALCPYTMSIMQQEHGWLATTRKKLLTEGPKSTLEEPVFLPDNVAYTAPTSAEAGMGLVLSQLAGGKYSAHDTSYKQNAARMCGTNPQ